MTHKPFTYNRRARILRRLLALRLAPQIQDWEIAANSRPTASGVLTSRAGGARTPRPVTHGG